MIKRFVFSLLFVCVGISGLFGCKEDPIEVIDTSCVFEATLPDGDTDNSPTLTLERKKGSKEGSFTMEYIIDQDLSLKMFIGDAEQASPYSFTLDAFGVLKFRLPALKAGEHVLKLVIRNQYNEMYTQELKFNIAKVVIPLKDITIVETMTLRKGSTMDTPVVFSPDNATDKTLYAVSSDEKVVTVEAVDGKLYLRALEGGSVIVTVQAADGDITRQMAVTVVDPADISVSPVEAYVKTGADYRFEVKVDGAFTASVADESLATVSEMGEDYVVVKNVSGSFYDERTTLTVVNSMEGGKRTSAGLVLQAKEEVVDLNVTSQSEGVTVVTVGNGCGRFDVVALPNGLTQTIDDRQITLVNNSYSDITGSIKVVSSIQKKEKALDITVKRASAILSNLVLSPENGSVFVGAGLTYTAKGVYSDGTQRDMTSSVLWYGDEYVSHDGNVFIGIKEGVATVSASVGDVSGSTKLTVRRNSVTKLSVTPSTFDLDIGGVVTFKVEASFEDGSSRDVTQELVPGNWSSSDNVSLNGSAMTAKREGAAWVEIVYDGRKMKVDGNVKVPAVTSLTISPSNIAMKVGAAQEYTVTANRADGSWIDVTSQVTWSCTSNLVRSGNMFTAGSVGAAKIEASYSGKTVKAEGAVVENASKNLSTVMITPATFSLVEGDKVTFTAKAFFSDGSEQVLNADNAMWSNSQNMVRVEGLTYQAASEGGGWVNVDYTYYGTKKSSKASGTVAAKDAPPVLKGVTIEPKSVSVKPGGGFSFTGTDVWSDGTNTHKGTFSATGTISGKDGSYTAVKEGTGTVTYSFGGYSVSASVTVLPPDDRVASVDKDVKYGVTQEEQYVTVASQSGNRDYWVRINGKSADTQSVGPEGGNVTVAFTAGHTHYEQPMKQRQVREKYYLKDVEHWTVSGTKDVNVRGPLYGAWTNSGSPVTAGVEITGSVTDNPSVSSNAGWLSVSGAVQSASSARTGVITGTNGGASASLTVSQYVLSSINVTCDVPQGSYIYFGQVATLSVEAVYTNGSKRDVTSLASYSCTQTRYPLDGNKVKHNGHETMNENALVNISYGGKTASINIGMGMRHYNQIRLNTEVFDRNGIRGFKPKFNCYWNDYPESFDVKNCASCDSYSLNDRQYTAGSEINADELKDGSYYLSLKYTNQIGKVLYCSCQLKVVSKRIYLDEQ